MNLLLLSGMSLRNQTWIRQVAKSLNSMFDKVIIHDYRHWQTGGAMDFDYEETEIAKKAAELDSQYAIFAKSAGAVLSIRTIAGGNLSPQKCVFCGVALKMAQKEGMEVLEWLQKIDCPVMFIQNTSDPAGSFKDLKKYVSQNTRGDYKFVKWPGNTHDYDNFEKLQDLVKDFVVS